MVGADRNAASLFWWRRRRIGSGEFPANNVAVYSRIARRRGDMASPQLRPVDRHGRSRSRGAVFVWEQASTAPKLPDGLRARFPRIDARQPLVLPLQSRTPRRPVIIGYAILPPRP